MYKCHIRLWEEEEEEKKQCDVTLLNQNAGRMMQIHPDNKSSVLEHVDGFIVGLTFAERHTDAQRKAVSV